MRLLSSGTRWFVFGIAACLFFAPGGCPAPEDAGVATGDDEPHGDDGTPTVVLGTSFVTSFANADSEDLGISTPNVAIGTVANHAVEISLSALTASSSVAAFEIVQEPAQGSLGPITRTGPLTGTVEYSPAPDFVGSVSFMYRATADGVQSPPGTVTIEVIPEIRFALSVWRGMPPLTVTMAAFTVQSTPLPDGIYAWQIGEVTEEGPVSTHGGRTHVFNRAGQFAVGLTVTIASLSQPIVCRSELDDATLATVIVDEPAIQIRGTVRNNAGAPLPGLLVVGSDGLYSAQTAGDGTYSLGVPTGWSGSVAPVSATQFAPISRSFNTLTSDAIGQDFTQLSANVPPGALAIDAPATLSAAGPQGGPFDPSTFQFSIQNVGNSPVDWTLNGASAWLSASAAAGSLDARTSANVTVSINTAANALSVGEYEQEISITNASSGGGSQSFVITLVVAPSTFTISGHVATAGGAPVSSVTMTGLPGNPTTDPSGNYAATAPYGWSGTVTPTKAGCTFAPASRAYNTVVENQPNQNFTANPAALTISGRITDGGGAGVSGVTMNGLPGTPTTDASGNYSAPVEYYWSGTVTPAKTGYSFSPASRAYVDVSVNRTGQNFTAAMLAVLAVSPAEGLSSAGNVGGPFSPNSKTYTLTNNGSSNLNWTASVGANWLTLSAPSGSLAGGDSTTVTVTIDADADGLSAGPYSDSVAFTNTTNGAGTQSRSVALNVNAVTVTPVIYTPPNTMRIAPYTALFSGLDSQSPSNDRIVRWNWDFGDASSADPQMDEGLIVAHRFDNAGTYTVSVTAITESGASATTTQQITVAAFNGHTYYVDATSGADSYLETEARNNQSKPWRSLTKAFSSAVRSLNSPCRILLKRGETWTLSADLELPLPCIVGAYGTGAKPVISLSSGAKLAAMIPTAMWGRSAVIEDLSIARAPMWQQQSGLFIDLVWGCCVRRCDMSGAGIIATRYQKQLTIEDSSISGSSRQGIYAGDVDSGAAGDIVLRRNSVFNNGTNAVLDHGIYINGNEDQNTFSGRPTARNLLVEDNTLYDNANYGLNLRMHDGCRIADNVLYGDGNEDYFASGGDGNANGIAVDCLWRCVTERNLIHTLSATQGLAVTVRKGGDWIIARNNIIRDCKQGLRLFEPWGSTLGCDRFEAYNNTVVLSNGICVGYESTFLKAGGTAIFTNNIFQSGSSVSGCLFEEYVIGGSSSGLAQVVSDYNAWYAPSNLTSAFDGGGYATWRGAGSDQHSLNVSPLVIPGTLELDAASPCRNAGVVLGAVFDDFSSAARDSTPNLGARE